MEVDIAEGGMPARRAGLAAAGRAPRPDATSSSSSTGGRSATRSSGLGPQPGLSRPAGEGPLAGGVSLPDRAAGRGRRQRPSGQVRGPVPRLPQSSSSSSCGPSDEARRQAGGHQSRGRVRAGGRGEATGSRPVEYIPGEPARPKIGRSRDGPEISNPGEPAGEGLRVPRRRERRHASVADGPPGLRVLGQYADAYIIAADEDGLLVIDQHNAHERVLFDRYAEIDRSRSWPVKMAPHPARPRGLALARRSALEAGRAVLEESGFRVEPMGGRSYALREYPDIFAAEEAWRRSWPCSRTSGRDKAEDRKARLLATMACKSAIKAGEPLPREKMEFLVRELFRTSNPAVCPHGRPIVVRLDRATFEKGLGRR